MSTSIAKQQIMKARQPKVVNVESLIYATNSDAVYQLIKKYAGGLSRSDLCTALVHSKSDLKEHSVDNALLHLKSNDFIRGEVGKDRDGTTVYFINEDKEYRPRSNKVTRKVAPNDKKAQKAVRRMTRVKAVDITEEQQGNLPLENANGSSEAPSAQAKKKPVQSQDANLKVTKKAEGKSGGFEFIQGMAALDPSSPHFGETALDLAQKTGQVVEIPEATGPVKPIASMFFELDGGQSVVLSPARAYQLYLELHAAFGKK